MNNKLYDKYINRELSWLEFNQRVLDEAKNNSPLLLEKLKFISIVSSNLDEFFMVRVASLYDQVYAGFTDHDISGLTPKEQLKLICTKVHDMVNDQYDCYNILMNKLKSENINIVNFENLTTLQEEFVYTYFHNTIYPIITPMVVDNSRPFPLIQNRTLNIALFLEGKSSSSPIFGTIQVPSVLGRLVKLPDVNNINSYILLEDIIKNYLSDIFTGFRSHSSFFYRVTRSADLSIDEEGAEDLLETIEQSLKMRKWGSAIRLEVEKNIDPSLLKNLIEQLECDQDSVYFIPGPFDLTFLMKLSTISGYENLKHPLFIPKSLPAFMESKNIFEAIKTKDILIHHPYQSFDYVVELVHQAANDPNVMAIKQTLYRVSGNSSIVKALMEAAENGKQVTVLVELKARFDEGKNIVWAKKLEQAGCHVIYGLVGLKIHGKILLVIRKEDNIIKRYVHLGTGNYNDATANLYTDIGLFTSNPLIGADASALFNMLSGYSQIDNMYKLIVAPKYLRNRFLYLIKNEANFAALGKAASITVKVNSLVDKEIIDALYDASIAGVKINLIIRGICCLRPGIKGMSENIRVISIVGRFLEHNRIYSFNNDGNELIYLSSADWMSRNLDRRVEIMFPIEDEENRDIIREIFEASFKDTEKARILESDGTYVKVSMQKSKKRFNSQEYFCKKTSKLIKRAKANKKAKILADKIQMANL